MAKLKIYSDIADDSQCWLDWCFGGDHISFNDVEAFIASIPADDDNIDMQINCRGGSTREALAIYDALRASGKTISAEVTGIAASSATIILCAARKDLRTARPNAQLLIHNPFVSGYVEGDGDDMRQLADDLDAEKRRFIDIYVDRTDADAATLEALMAQDKPMGVEKAIELGFINNIIYPISAKMNKAKSLFVALGKALGMTTLGMTLETADGGKLELVKEQGEPMVGDEVTSPDGEYLMPDGNKIKVEMGKITEIEAPDAKPVETTERAPESPEGACKPKVKDSELEEVDKDARIAELEQAVADKDAKIIELEQKLKDAEANGKTIEDKAILNAVAIAGGRKWLATVATSKESIPAKEFATPEKKEKESYIDYHNRMKKSN